MATNKGREDALAKLKEQMAAKKIDMSGDGFSNLNPPLTPAQKRVAEIMAPYQNAAADKKKADQKQSKMRLDEIRANIVKNTKQPWQETGFQPEYTKDELAVVVARNRANAEQQQSSIQEYNAIAAKLGLPAWDASTPKTGNKTGTKTTQTEYTDKEIQRILTSGTPAEKEALDAAMNPESDNPKPKPKSNNPKPKPKSAETITVLKTERKRRDFTRKYGNKMTREERNKFKKDGIIPDRFIDIYNSGK